jgi:DGQHR domain-containing protein
MVPYLVEAADHFYSALTVEIRPAPCAGEAGAIAFEARDRFPGGIEFGVLTLDGTEALYALDGQHRLKSIELAIRQQPELAREHITLILVPFQSVPRSQTLFSDLNRSQVIAEQGFRPTGGGAHDSTLAVPITLCIERVSKTEDLQVLSAERRHLSAA